MSRSPQTDLQLQAMAAGADRNNRPRALIVLGAVLLLAALGYVGVAYAGFRASSASVRVAYTEAEQIEAELREHRALTEARPDLARLYKPAYFLRSNLESTAKEAFGLAEDDSLTSVGVRINEQTTKAVITTDELKEEVVRISVINQPLEDILAWLDLLARHEEIGRGFVSELTLNPTPTGWTANFTYSIYTSSKPRS